MLVTQPRADFEPFHAMMRASISSKAIMGAVRLKLFDYLEERPVGLSELAAEMDVVAVRLEPLLELLVAAGLLEKIDGAYRNTLVASEFLVSDSPFYQKQSMELALRFNAMVEDSIVELLSGDEVKRTSTDESWGVEDTMEGTAQDARGGALAPVIDFVSGLPGFDDFRNMCDIGGNHGLYTLGVLERNESVSGTIFDLPHVVESSKRRCEQLGFGDRVSTIAGDLREDSLPEGQFDLILTSHVLYGFLDDFDGAVQKIADGLQPGGWFISHHYAGRNLPGDEMAKGALELLTRLCGYSSHFIEREQLSHALEAAGFEDVRFKSVSENGMGLITAARKKG